MTSDTIPESEVLFVMDFGFGPEATTLWSSAISVCAPCLEHDGVHRRAAFTGTKSMDLTAPNLCRAHWDSYRRGTEWDRPLRPSRGRPPSVAECGVEGCSKGHYATGLCRSHYEKAKRRERREADQS